MSLEPLLFDSIHAFVGKEKVSEYIGIPFVDEDVMEEGGDIGHEGNGFSAEVVKDFGEGVHEVGSAQKLLVEACAADRSSGVVADTCLALFFHHMERKMPMWFLWVEGMIDVVHIDGVALFVEFPDLAEDAGFPWKVSSKAWNHAFQSAEGHRSGVDGVEDSGRFLAASFPGKCRKVFADFVVEADGIPNLPD